MLQRSTDDHAHTMAKRNAQLRTPRKRNLIIGRNGLRPTPHDRRAEGLPRGASVAVVEVDDPMEPGARIVAVRSIRDDVLAALRARSQISECQFQAGRAWQRLYRQAEIGGVLSIDPAKMRVDGGNAAERGARQIRAVLRLTHLRHALGANGDTVLRDVLVAGMTLRAIAAMRGLDARAGSNDLVFLGRRLRECLDTVAREFGLA
jgi:hypothetical protein